MYIKSYFFEIWLSVSSKFYFERIKIALFISLKYFAYSYFFKMIVSFFETLEVHLSFLIFIFFLGREKKNRMTRNDGDSFFFLMFDEGNCYKKS